MPISYLPFLKSDIKIAIRTEMVMTKFLKDKGEMENEEYLKYMNSLEMGFITLSGFVEGVEAKELNEYFMEHSNKYSDQEISSENMQKIASDLQKFDELIENAKKFASNLLKSDELIKDEREILTNEIREFRSKLDNI